MSIYCIINLPYILMVSLDNILHSIFDFGIKNIKNISVKFENQNYSSYVPWRYKKWQNIFLVGLLDSFLRQQILSNIKLVLYSSMTSFIVYINNTVINLLIYFNSHMLIDQQIINIIPEWIHVFIQDRDAYIKHKNSCFRITFKHLLLNYCSSVMGSHQTRLEM